MIIAVDFDGTLVEHRYPEIGKEKPFAFAALKRLQKNGHQLILWTSREGKLLDDAVEYCAQRGVIFYAINANNPDEKIDARTTPCRKVVADVYIDDRNIGGLPDWGTICEILNRGITYEDYLAEAYQYDANKSFWSKLFGK